MNKFVVLVALLTIVNSKVVMTKDQWVAALVKIAKSPSEYKSVYPYNVLYWDGKKWYCDCVNLMKALFNGRKIDNPKKNSHATNLSNTGDVGADGFIKLCDNVSTDFKKLKAGEPRILHLKGHIGAYLGKEMKVSKGIVNVVECTGGWEHKALFSYVDSDGTRRYAKGSSNVRGKWERHGKASKWVKY
jgi:hypothetical protein